MGTVLDLSGKLCLKRKNRETGMPRVIRDKGVFCTYHIIQRGNERKEIFLSGEDREKYIDVLDRAKNKYNFLVWAFCLMGNHIHLLINDNGNDISQIIKSISISYTSYFNRTYKETRGRFSCLSH